MAFRTNKMPVLQEKSASGAVATFNTALAMPLSSCNIAVNAWQEGSGDPSPSNVRPIHGFSEVNLTANNVVHTIQFGQEVYGGTFNAATCVLTINRIIKTINEDSTLAMANQSYIRQSVTDVFIYDGSIYPQQGTSYTPADVCCNRLKRSTAPIWSGNANPNTFTLNVNQIHMNFDNTVVGITDYSQETPETAINKIKEWLTNNNIILTIPIREQTIQLTPTQIETIIGNNTIFADTGDVDLTYKDLDIAKRGNFREVFRLPS